MLMCTDEKKRSVRGSLRAFLARPAAWLWAARIFGLCGVLSAAQAATDYVSYSGTAYAWQGEQVLYHEHHVVQYQEGQLTERVVLYECASGQPFARKELHYRDLLAPDFRFEDQRNGVVEGLLQTGAGRSVFFKEDFAGQQMQAALPPTEGLVADAGFDEFIRSRWQSLMSERSEPIRFLIPSRLQAMGFTVQHRGQAVVEGVPAEVFHLNLAGLLGWFLSGIDVYYSSAQHVLLRYAGLSNLRDSAGHYFKADIAFPVNRRVTATEADMRIARSVPLTSCLKDASHT